MQTPNTLTCSLVASADVKGSSAKLASLLALAGGAIAIPQTGEASVIYSNLTANPIIVTETTFPAFVIDLPGTAELGFVGGTLKATFSEASWIKARQNAGYVRLKTLGSFIVPVPETNRNFADVPGSAKSWGFVGFVTTFKVDPALPYTDNYLAFKFRNSEQGNLECYGWLRLSLNNQGPTLTISGWAYDDAGNPLPTALVPEPGSASLLALGALALGAKGVRAWRRNRPAAQS